MKKFKKFLFLTLIASLFITPISYADWGGLTNAIGDGRKTVSTAGTAERLDTREAIVYRVIITAETDNTGIITVGSSTVVGALGTRRGVPLEAGDSVTFVNNRLSDIWLDTTVNGDGVTFLYFY